MSNENHEKDIVQIVDGMHKAASLEMDNINSRCREMGIQMKSLAEQSIFLLAKIEKPRADDKQSRFDKIMLEGMSYEELAIYAAEGWSWATYMEDAYDKTIQNQHIEDELGKLSDELEVLAKRRDEVISTLDEVGLSVGHAAEILEERCNAYQQKKALKEEVRKPRARGGERRHANSPYPAIKAAVIAAWEKCLNKSAYGSRTAFAHRMLKQYKHLKSIEVVNGWTREHDKAKAKGKSDSTS